MNLKVMTVNAHRDSFATDISNCSKSPYTVDFLSSIYREDCIHGKRSNLAQRLLVVTAQYTCLGHYGNSSYFPTYASAATTIASTPVVKVG